MLITSFQENGQLIAEVSGAPGSIRDPETINDLIGKVAFEHRISRLLAGRELIDESFFDLKSGFAGELTQKISNYRLMLAVYGDFSIFESLALKAYLLESRLSKTVRFFPKREAALDWLSKA